MKKLYWGLLFLALGLIPFVILFEVMQKKVLVNILAIALVCFAVCDTFIGFANIGPYMSISEGSLIYKLLSSEIDIAWAFYVPSQALLSISLLTQKIKKRV